MNITISNKKVRLDSVVMDNVCVHDFPHFSDAYATRAEFEDGTLLTEAELNTLTHTHGNAIVRSSIL